MRTELILDALEMARRSRGTHLEGWSPHSGAGWLTSPASATANASPSWARCDVPPAEFEAAYAARRTRRTIETLSTKAAGWIAPRCAPGSIHERVRLAGRFLASSPNPTHEWRNTRGRI
jgi:hypothetical protein